MVVASRAGFERRFKVTQADLARQLGMNHHDQVLDGRKSLAPFVALKS